MEPSFLNRNVNEGFSGGEKKRNEILQMAVLDTKIAILDETDSGLDIDALKTVSSGIKKLANVIKCNFLITHYQRLIRLYYSLIMFMLCVMGEYQNRR